MDVNTIKEAFNSASSVDEIITVLDVANKNNVTLEPQYLTDLLAQQSVQVEGKTGITLFYSGGLQTDGNGGIISWETGGYQAWRNYSDPLATGSFGTSSPAR
jgi:hypothetical protein